MSANQYNFVRDRNGKVVDGLLIQKATDKQGTVNRAVLFVLK